MQQVARAGSAKLLVNEQASNLTRAGANSCQHAANALSTACHVAVPSWSLTAAPGCCYAVDPLLLLAVHGYLPHAAAASDVRRCGCVCGLNAGLLSFHEPLLQTVALKARDSAPPVQGMATEKAASMLVTGGPTDAQRPTQHLQPLATMQQTYIQNH